MANLLTHQVCTNKLYVIREKRTADLPVGFFVAVFRFEKASFVLLIIFGVPKVRQLMMFPSAVLFIVLTMYYF